MPKINLLFEIPLPIVTIKGGLRYTKTLGTLTISGECNTADTEDIEISEVEYCGVNILPVLQYQESKGASPLLDEIYETAIAHLEHRRYESNSNY